MNPDLEKLRTLQEADRELARLVAEIAALPKRMAAIEAKLADAKGRKEKAQAAIKAGESARRKYESDIQAQQQKISKYREQMLDVKTNEQYKALLHEVEFAEKEIRNLEDKILEGMVDAEQRERDLKAADAELKAEAIEIEKEKEDARQRTEIDQKLSAELNRKRDELRGAVDQDVLRHYDRVAKFRGTAISEALDHKCSACQVMLRPQVYNEVRSSDKVLTCDFCQRILWYDPSKEPEQAPRPERKSIRYDDDDEETAAPADQEQEKVSAEPVPPTQ